SDVCSSDLGRFGIGRGAARRARRSGRTGGAAAWPASRRAASGVAQRRREKKRASPGVLGGEIDAPNACQAGRFHDIDHRLVSGLCIGVDQQQRLRLAGGGQRQGLRHVGGSGGVDQRAVDGVAAVAADCHFDGGWGFLFDGGLGQGDLQLGEARERGRGGQENQDDQQHVDQRDQVDLEFV